MANTDRPTSADALVAARHFELLGEPRDARPYGSGHINDTFLVECKARFADVPYILQRINHNVFPRPEQVMENICRVTDHLRAGILTRGGNPDRESLTVVPASDGRPFHIDANGLYWRAYIFIIGARTHDVLTDNRQAYQAAKAFGTFQRLLADLPGVPLHETIVNFHHTPSRFAKLKTAAELDDAGRLASCREDVDFALAQKPITTLVVDGLESGDLPWRVTHNDTKINNVMLDDSTGDAICVIDLDTVMPGSALYDFGDQVRTSVGHFTENERDLSKVYIDLDRFDCLARGFLESAGESLVPAEIDNLAFAGILITYMIGIRFLADYLEGDVYFKTHRPDENLDRARTQFALVKDMQKQRNKMDAIVRNYR